MRTDRVPGFAYARSAGGKPSGRYLEIGERMLSLYREIEQKGGPDVREVVAQLDEVVGESEAAGRLEAYLRGLEDGLLLRADGQQDTEGERNDRDA